jgi:hypothetical protein
MLPPISKKEAQKASEEINSIQCADQNTDERMKI